MKKTALILVIILFVSAIFASCGKEPVQDPTDTTAAPIETTAPLGETTTSPETTAPPETTDNPPIGGSHMGDELYSLYNNLVDGITSIDDTFSEHYSKYMDDYIETARKQNNDRPSVLFYLSKKMDLTREDLETYFTACGSEDVPEYVYEGLLANTLEESMQILKSKYAFYNNGKLYNVYDIYDLYEKNQLDFDINDSVYDPVWRCIFDYLNTPHESFRFGEPFKQFVLKNTKGVDGYTTAEETTYVPETNEFGRVLRDSQKWAKKLIQRKELLPDEEIILQYHIPGSIFDIVICSSESEKYSIYIVDSYLPEEELVYSKLVFEIPEEIEYDDYRIVTEYLIAYGDVHSSDMVIGDGSCDICVEFTKGEEKSYLMFCVNLAEEKKDIWGIFEVRELTEIESSNLNKAIYMASINYKGRFGDK